MARSEIAAGRIALFTPGQTRSSSLLLSRRPIVDVPIWTVSGAGHRCPGLTPGTLLSAARTFLWRLSGRQRPPCPTSLAVTVTRHRTGGAEGEI